MSVHSGSDKFTLYPLIRKALGDFDAGVHLKTAGTTWLEELIGLAASGGDGLAIAKEIYVAAVSRMPELCAPYASVIDIDLATLPSPETIKSWDGERFAAAMRHDPACPSYNSSLRQLLHVGYRVAAEMGRFTAALEKHSETISAGVTDNLSPAAYQPVVPGLTNTLCAFALARDPPGGVHHAALADRRNRVRETVLDDQFQELFGGLGQDLLP